MPITAIHSYLVHPSKGAAKAGDDQPQIGGTEVTHGRLLTMLRRVYDGATEDCDTEIAFNHNDAGKQQNDCRDALIAYIRQPSLDSGRVIAQMLQNVTDRRSGYGLLFLTVGKESHDHKLLVSRFPAQEGVYAEENKQNLTVEFLERIFMKDAYAYKAALYRGSSMTSHFWDGAAIDRQMDSSANYWVRDFLKSELRVTAAAGTQRLAKALRDAMKDGNTDIRDEIASACKLAAKLGSESTSIRALANRFNLSEEAQELIQNKLKNPASFTERFSFSREEFQKYLKFRSVELDNGGVMTADAVHFDRIFRGESIDGKDGEIRFTTEGKVVSQKLKKTI